jgi:3-phenylpropionate/trans-cinnamate dioxygenase ferredoxin subunit
VPLWEERRVSKHVVAAVSDVPPGGRKLVTVKGRPIALFNLGGEFYGLSNRCPHQGGSLCEGTLTGLVSADRPGEYQISRKGEIIRCPWHGWEFDIRTGQSWCEPGSIRTRHYAIEIVPGTQVVEGPHAAETIPVAVEENYVVVDV